MKGKGIKMNQQKIKELKEQSYIEEVEYDIYRGHAPYYVNVFSEEKFAELIIQECINKIESYRIPCGNSPSGELACEYTYDALKSIRDDIKETFGVKE